MSHPHSRLDGPETGVAGWEEATALLRQVRDGVAPVHAGITGPGGSGKSTLLAEIASTLRSEGIRVAEGLDEVGRIDSGPERITLIVDDLERLGDDDIARLSELACPDGPHLVAAFRSWPRSDAAAELVERLGRRRPHIGLRPLSPVDVRARAAELLGDAPSLPQLERLTTLAGGNPRLVDLLLAALRDEAWDPRTSSPLPVTLLAQLRHRLDRLDREFLDFLVALAVGFSGSGPVLAMAPRFRNSDLHGLMSEARASGLVAPDGSLIPIVRFAVLQSAPEHELWAGRREFVDAMEAARLPLGESALELARGGYRDVRVADALQVRGDALLPTEPAEAWEQYTVAIEAGADAPSLAGRRAQAAWSAGDIHAAERLVDGLLAAHEHPDLPRVMNVAAAIWARRGMPGRAAETYLGLAEADAWGAEPLAAVCQAATGELAQARATLAAASNHGVPGSSQVAVLLMAEGMIAALEGASDCGLSSLLQASSIMNESREIVPLPEVPAVLAAHVAVNAGELGIAVEVLQAAGAAEQGGLAFENRLRLTEALIELRADHPARARALLTGVDESERPLGLRSDVLAHAVRIGLARRTDDLAALVRAWSAARPVIARMPIDLMGLASLAELAIAAARLGETHLLEAPLAAAEELLERAGRPAAWSMNLHWAGIQSAILREDRPELERHAAALLEMAAANRVAGMLAEAGRVWAAALAGRAETIAVEHAVRDLAAAGYRWDAGRLAGHAAGRAAEHTDTLQLMALARSMHAEDGRSDTADGAGEDGRRDEAGLSAREREVARLVLEGKTYAEIGSTIFISPRTAEHHIARIRRRLGVTTRSELLARLRLVLAEEDG
ncbi:helix-turn-helix transcriptional regulator [Agromyces sp. H66]|uniref:helix-turn-helix transcriptional regulator n=1 Tax=Agromyces sp. H66 TaxID=2529859 RepID=UPI0010AAEF4B|nr:helix-turn-helix transcriptional regulator [Agromyces sp. H66]